MIFTVELEYNEKVNYVNCTTINDNIQDTRLNIFIQTYEDLENVFAVYTIFLKDSDYDKKISRILFQTNINMKKLFNGVQGSYVLTQFYETLQNSIGVKLEMPLKKVMKFYDQNIIQIMTCPILSWFQGARKFGNMTFPSYVYPFKSPIWRAVVNLTGVIERTKRRVWHSKFTGIGRFTWY